ncbi:hypothetical protein PAAG_08225 [Paracoccidioides lutzii Pb01]|uniref:Uncharacterized protein n=1 Tax=Paracoccidioides lutzii (strain ATCC MYA-826 / Pb01) TaxID=502779 RepID=C1HBT4_PARBA|nr:hypothetical protein PAAG_08225 [Paracoccidioides lutzii Pb01]EEH38498.2 hypothetical protein PAAG_08225 [Paracoccidioides lutzii Pb01]
MTGIGFGEEEEKKRMTREEAEEEERRRLKKGRCLEEQPGTRQPTARQTTPNRRAFTRLSRLNQTHQDSIQHHATRIQTPCPFQTSVSRNHPPIQPSFQGYLAVDWLSQSRCGLKNPRRLQGRDAQGLRRPAGQVAWTNIHVSSPRGDLGGRSSVPGDLTTNELVSEVPELA